MLKKKWELQYIVLWALLVYSKSINSFLGVMPLEVRFLHDPKATVGFVGCALFGKVFKFFKKEDGTWDAKKVIDIPAKKVEG